jgi:PAS domain S-box-containing protein
MKDVTKRNKSASIKKKKTPNKNKSISKISKLTDQPDAPTVKPKKSTSDTSETLHQLKQVSQERHKFEKALRQSEEEYRSLVNNLNIGVYRNTGPGRGRFIKANPAIAAIFGYDSLDEFLKVPVADLYKYPEDRERFIDQVVENGYVKGQELLLKKKDGTPIWASCTATAKYDNKGNIHWIDGIIEDITKRKQAEQALRENEFKFRSLFDLSPQAVALVDYETGALLEVNDKFCDLFNYSRDEAIGKSTVELGIHSKQKRATFLDELHKTGEVHGMAADLKAKHGIGVHAHLYSKLIRMKGETFILTILLDFTEQKRLEAQFQQAQRIEAIGTLAGGIAHDFNNLLMAIQGNVSLLRMQFEITDEVAERLESIEEYIQNGSELTRQLLGFARGGQYEIKPSNLNDLIMKCARMFGRTKKNITIQHELENDLWTVSVDRGQIEQVFLNLFVNAGQAMPDGGEIFLKTENVRLDHSFIRPFEVKHGKYVKMCVCDTGIGMNKKVLERIFNPFFTTKERGAGTGLGLASAYGIIKNHGGIIEANSETGKGAVFEIYLPVSEEKTKTIAGNSEHADSLKSLQGNETILFVDDEDRISNVADQMLQSLGYQVLVATGGKEAVDIFHENKDLVNMVILDLIMPDMGGVKTYDRLKQIDPGVKVLISSGYSVDGEAAALIDRGGDGFIQKPFNALQLSQKVREILDARPN